MIKFFVCTLLFLSVIQSGLCQQMVVMKNRNIITRYNPGDEIILHLKAEDQTIRRVIQSVREFYFITTHNDTIAYQNVSRLEFRNPARKKYAKMLAIAGAGLFAVYLINREAFSQNENSLDGLKYISLYSVGVAGLIYFTSDKKIRLNGIKRIKMINYDSPPYR